jgi:hypothetical protein
VQVTVTDLTDERLQEIERLWLRAIDDVGTSTLAYKSLVTLPEVIKALRGVKEDEERQSRLRSEDIAHLLQQIQERQEEIDRLRGLLDNERRKQEQAEFLAEYKAQAAPGVGS